MANLFINNQAVEAGDFSPHDSLLNFLRERRGLTGSKEGCGSGDCGACTVVVRPRPGPDGRPATPININSCITPLGAVLGAEVLTVEGVGQPDKLHVVQQAMVDHHGSQCGFCTPGFVMSLVAKQLGAGSPAELRSQSRRDAIESISGNLCRCTGYRPILDAALAANAAASDESVALFDPTSASESGDESRSGTRGTNYQQPGSLAELCTALQAVPTGTTSLEILLAGTTDRWLDVTQRYQDLPAAIDINRVRELREIAVQDNRLIIGAAVTHSELLQFFAGAAVSNTQPGAQPVCHAITGILERFGSPQVRNRGTIGGNIANASPIADWPPLLLAMDARLTVMSAAGDTRNVALSGFYQGYKQTELAADEFIVSINCVASLDWNSLIALKVSKRIEDDISSTMLAVYIEQDAGKDNAVTLCRVAMGGVAATPIRVAQVEALLTGKPLTDETIRAASNLLRQQLQPITDVRASADYRREASGAILTKALLELRDGQPDTLTTTVLS